MNFNKKNIINFKLEIGDVLCFLAITFMAVFKEKKKGLILKLEQFV